MALKEQLSAYNPKPNQRYITTRFVDGFQDSIRSIVLVLVPAIWILLARSRCCRRRRKGRQDQRTTKKPESSSYTKPQSFRSRFPLPPPPVKLVAVPDERCPADNRRPLQHGATVDENLSTLRNYRKAQGLCMRCGDKWALGHHCAPQM